MLFSRIINEQDYDKHLAEIKFNAKEKYYKLIGNRKFNSKILVSIALKNALFTRIKKTIVILLTWY